MAATSRRSAGSSASSSPGALYIDSGASDTDADDSDDLPDIYPGTAQKKQHVALVSAPYVPSPGQWGLKIFIDVRERMRNPDPREMLRSLQRAAPRYTDLLMCPQQPGVGREQIEVGDFAYKTGARTAEGHPFSGVAMERKTISDLVSRSTKGDHDNQMSRMVLRAKHAFFQLEGDPKLAGSYDAFGDDASDTTVQHEDDVFYTFARWHIVHEGKVKHVQTRNLEDTSSAVVALGLAAAEQTACHQLPALLDGPAKKGDPARALEARIFECLKHAGVPVTGAPSVKLAAIYDRFKGWDALVNAYAACTDDRCRALMLEHIVRGNTESSTPATGSAPAWSEMIWRAVEHRNSKNDALGGPGPDETLVGKLQQVQIVFAEQFSGVKILAELVAARGDVETAVESLCSEAPEKQEPAQRTVEIEIAQTMFTGTKEKKFKDRVFGPEDLPTTRAVVTRPVRVNGQREAIKICVTGGGRRSEHLHVFVIRAEIIHAALSEHLQSAAFCESPAAPWRFQVVAKRAAETVLRGIDAGARPGALTILVVEGLKRCADRILKERGAAYQSEMPKLAHLVLIHLQIASPRISVFQCFTVPQLRKVLRVTWSAALDYQFLSQTV